MSKKITLFDAIEQNFKQKQWKAPLSRGVYIVEHDLENPEEYLQDLVKECNSSYCDVLVTGLSLVHLGYVIFILEGSEDTLSRHMKMLLKSPHIRNAKLLMMFHDRNKKWFDNFICMPVSLENKAMDISAEDTRKFYFEQLSSFMDKITEICKTAADLQKFSAVDLKSDILVPDEETLEFFLSSEFSMGIQEYINLSEELPSYQHSFELCWPAPYDFTPRLVDKSKVKVDFVQPLPD